MSTVLSAIFLLALLAILPLYAMYFASLLEFGKTFQRLHPGLYEQLVGPKPPSLLSSSRTYRLFRALQSGNGLAQPVSPGLLSAYRVTRRHLLLGLWCFMVLLFAALAQEFVS